MILGQGKRRLYVVVLSVFGGLVSQIRAFYIGYRLTREQGDELILDLSQYYRGYYQPYLLECLNIPLCKKFMHRGKDIQDRIDALTAIFGVKPVVLRNGEELEKEYGRYDKNKIYYIVNDCCEYDSFCMNHKHFFFRYIGNDKITNELMDFMSLRKKSAYMESFEKEIKNRNSVGVHIRMRDFIKIGWFTEKDFSFYRAAIQWVREHTEEPNFYIFSDDIDGASQIVGSADDIFYMHKEDGERSDVEELLCLSMCKHKVLSKKSGYSLFAATMSRNKWGLGGYTVIIEKMDLALDAADKEYIDYNFNQNKGCHKNEDLENCITLDTDEIFKYSEKYCFIPIEKNISYKSGATNGGELIGLKKKSILFCTWQTFSDNMIRGMEYLASYLSENGYDVHFIGKRKELENDETDLINWTFENSVRAHDMNGKDLGITIYPYSGLNKECRYLDFIEALENRCGNSLIVIVRKVSALPLKKSSRKVKYLFIDFPEKYGTENQDYVNDQLSYLYHNADKVITFNKTSYNRLLQQGKTDITYIDIECIFPSYICKGNSIDDTCSIRSYERNLCESILEVISSFGE